MFNKKYVLYSNNNKKFFECIDDFTDFKDMILTTESFSKAKKFNFKIQAKKELKRIIENTNEHFSIIKIKI